MVPQSIIGNKATLRGLNLGINPNFSPSWVQLNFLQEKNKPRLMYELESQNVTNSSFYLFNFVLKIKCLLNVLTRVYADCTEAQRAQNH